MTNSPHCSLCSGELTMKKGVCAGDRSFHTCAWVCTRCSALFPVAVQLELRSWGRGRRFTDRPLLGDRDDRP